MFSHPQQFPEIGNETSIASRRNAVRNDQRRMRITVSRTRGNVGGYGRSAQGIHSDRRSAHGVNPTAKPPTAKAPSANPPTANPPAATPARTKRPKAKPPMENNPKARPPTETSPHAILPIAIIPFALQNPKPTWICTSGSPQSVRLLLYSYLNL